MYTGIIQAVAPIASLEDQPGYRKISLTFPPDLHEGRRLGASVWLDGNMHVSCGDLRGHGQLRRDRSDT